MQQVARFADTSFAAKCLPRSLKIPMKVYFPFFGYPSTFLRVSMINYEADAVSLYITFKWRGRSK